MVEFQYMKKATVYGFTEILFDYLGATLKNLSHSGFSSKIFLISIKLLKIRATYEILVNNTCEINCWKLFTGILLKE